MIVKNCTLALVLLGGFAAGASESQELLEKGGVIGKIVLVSFGLTKTF